MLFSKSQRTAFSYSCQKRGELIVRGRSTQREVCIVKRGVVCSRGESYHIHSHIPFNILPNFVQSSLSVIYLQFSIVFINSWFSLAVLLGLFWFKTHGYVLLLKHLCYFSLIIIKVFFFLQYIVFGLCPCCFCKLLGFNSMRICRLLWFVPCYATFMFCCLILLAKCYAFSLCILTLVPLQDFVPRCIYFMYCALVECWVCK